MGIASSRNSEDSTPPPAADDSDSGSDSNEEVSAPTVYARSPFRRGQLVLVPAIAFGDEYAAENPATYRGSPRTGRYLGMFVMTFPFGPTYVHVVTCASFHGIRDRTLWCVDHIKTRFQNPNEKYPGHKDNLRWLPIFKELAEQVGLPTNSGRADESETQSSRKRRASKTGIPFWFREFGATDSDGWTKVRSMTLLLWFLNGEEHPVKEVNKRMIRELYEVTARDQYLLPWSADRRATERKSIRRSDGVLFEVTRNEPSNVTEEYNPENYYGGNASSDEDSDDLEEQPVPTQPVSTQSVPAQPVVVEAPKKLCPRCVTHIDRRRRKRKKQDDSDEEFDSDEEVAAVVAVPARKRPTRQKVAAPQTAAEFQVGDPVEARFMEGEDWLPGTIKECNGDGMYAITFYDGSEDDPVREDHIRRPIVADQ